MKILLTWLGNADLDKMEKNENASIASIAIKSAVSFDKIVILANKDDTKWNQFESFLIKRCSLSGKPHDDIKVNRAHLQSPINYNEVARVSKKWIQKLSDEADELYINLTSGTPTMSTMSVLIGKAKSNVKFIQSSEQSVPEIVDIPLDFTKEYNQSTSRSIASNASSVPKLSRLMSSVVVESDIMKEVVHKATTLAMSELSVLILGETGTGKEVMAKAIHSASQRKHKPIKVVNCGALAESLVDSILFGHVKGAFTGANNDHAGVFEQADGGTLFLDEIGELKPDIQVKLLRTLQEGEITRVGDSVTRYVDVRIIAATHQDLLSLVATNLFREDLFYRLAVGIINMPSLKHRRDDIRTITLQLCHEINQVSSKQYNYTEKYLSDDAMDFIVSHSWPGNIRELWSTLNRAFLWSDSDCIHVNNIIDSLIIRKQGTSLTEVILSPNEPVDIKKLSDDYQRAYVHAALKATNYHKTSAAKLLGLNSHQVLGDWIKRLEIGN